MAEQSLNVNPELIRWAIERSGRSVDALARYLPRIEEWESGEAQPTLRQLETLAKKTWTPIGYFFLPAPPEERLPVPDFRTARDEPIRRPSPNLIDTLHTMQRRQSWMRDYLIEMDHERLSFIGSAKPGDKVESVAKNIRRTLGMSDGWAGRIATWTLALGALREAAEAAGIFVVINGVVGNDTHRKLDPAEFRGFVLADEYAPIVFINGADARSAQMFTLAHELAHFWIGEGGIFDLPDLQADGDRREVFCNRVAAEFLVPEVELNAFWREARHQPEPFQAIARKFKVSPIVAARRALDLDLIARDQFFDFYRAYQADERRQAARSKGGGDFYNNQNVRVGKRFVRAVALAAKEGRLLYREAYSLTGLQGATFDKYAKALGINL
ncbi:MAG: ImmA/IrrE family metallo-endopeptidase [Pseudomonadota bacterium]|jgi:Zn-dependent peptidase ImmA (M78 family)|nr:ImmA/IrrE family metallo-endopeptidase [Pseudomonadota bacterium]